jgi:hypothetical protein
VDRERGSRSRQNNGQVRICWKYETCRSMKIAAPLWWRSRHQPGERRGERPLAASIGSRTKPWECLHSRGVVRETVAGPRPARHDAVLATASSGSLCVFAPLRLCAFALIAFSRAPQPCCLLQPADRVQRLTLVGRRSYTPPPCFCEEWSLIVWKTRLRGVAQSGSAPALGAGGRRFKSSRPDHTSEIPRPACSSAG